MSAKQQVTADSIIREARTKSTPYKLSPEVKTALKKFLTHNDSSARHERVTTEAAIRFLQERGLQCGVSKFQKIIKSNFGRSWSGQ